MLGSTMNALRPSWFVGALAAVWLAGCATSPSTRSFPEAAALPVRPGLPDPLVMQDGHRITSAAQWRQQRRPELEALFQHYMYGAIPPQPGSLQVESLVEYGDFLGGKARLRLVTLRTGRDGAPRIDLLLVLPNFQYGPRPVFLGMNFCGNQAITDDPRVPLARGWVPSICKGCSNNVASEASRLATTNDWPKNEWPLDRIIGRGYAFAGFYSGDIDPDRADVSDGLYRWLAGGDAARNGAADRGTIAAWAWGFQRCVDYLATLPELDPNHIAVVGHSRNGKAALLAAAFDERIALVVAHQAGCGGSAPSRGKVGEQLSNINGKFPHWFNAEFKTFNAAPERLPFDQHELVALCAPRAVLFSNGRADQWANPAGQFEVLKAADPVYRLLGVDGLGTGTTLPPPGALTGGRLGYYLREGGHAMTASDWEAFLDFAERQWKEPAP
jgi:hypothetical protein